MNSKNKTIHYTSFSTPIGRVYLTATEKGIYSISLGYNSKKEFIANFKPVANKGTYLTTLKNDILKYLSGKPISFKKHKLDLHGTEFQKRVWNVLSTIPYGKVLTYKEVAEKAGIPKAFRAVGSACGANNLPIIIPCHRVIASNGSLGGFSGGLGLKQYLLQLEGAKPKNKRRG